MVNLNDLTGKHVRVEIKDRIDGVRILQGLFHDMIPGGCIDIIPYNGKPPVELLESTVGGDTTIVPFYTGDQGIISIQVWNDQNSVLRYSNRRVAEAYSGPHPVQKQDIANLREQEEWDGL